MAGLVKTVSDLLSDTRSLLDEDNLASVSTVDDLLPALNRAQDYAANILSRHYESPLLTYTTVNTTGGLKEYEIPEDAFEERIEKVEVQVNGNFYPLQRINYRDISIYESQSAVSIPYYYCVVGNRIRLLPGPTGTYPLRVWYLVDPYPLVEPQGRITLVNEADNYVRVDAIGSDLTTETDQLNSYVNLVDGHSGKIKGSFQIQTITDNKIQFKSSPMRSSVLNFSISDDLAALTDAQGQAIHVEEDDYVCVIKGTCIPFFKKPFSNFLIQYAVAEIRRKLGGPADIELNVLKNLEDQVERSWVGRENSLRVQKRSGNWDYFSRRWYIRN